MSNTERRIREIEQRWEHWACVDRALTPKIDQAEEDVAFLLSLVRRDPDALGRALRSDDDGGPICW